MKNRDPWSQFEKGCASAFQCWQLMSCGGVRCTLHTVNTVHCAAPNHLARGNAAAGWRNQHGGGKKEENLILLTALYLSYF